MSNTALTPRTSALPDVPSRRDLEALSPADLWTLEERATLIQDACRELNDERLREWIEVRGLTQTDVAKMVGRSQQAISKRCARLGITFAKGKGTVGGRPTAEVTTGCNPIDIEEVDAEVVDEVEPSAPSPDLHQGAPDPGPAVRCPTCGHMVRANDIQTWKE